MILRMADKSRYGERRVTVSGWGYQWDTKVLRRMWPCIRQQLQGKLSKLHLTPAYVSHMRVGCPANVHRMACVAIRRMEFWASQNSCGEWIWAVDYLAVMVLCRADAKLIRHTFGICGGNLMIGVRQAIDIAVGPGLKVLYSRVRNFLCYLLSYNREH